MSTTPPGFPTDPTPPGFPTDPLLLVCEFVVLDFLFCVIKLAIVIANIAGGAGAPAHTLQPPQSYANDVPFFKKNPLTTCHRRN